MPGRRRVQLDLPMPPGWGGTRKGAGRKTTLRRPGPTHARRADHVARHPVHLTLRAATDVPSLRSVPIFGVVERAIGTSNGAAFRTIHFSVQLDHVHLIVEADSPRAFRRGVRSLVIRCALAVNRAAKRRGPVWRHRYHARSLRTPSEMRRAIAYVLLNFRKHLRAAPGVDPRSSSVWFEEWNLPFPRSVMPRLVATPRTWLASTGWRRAAGALDVRETPRLASEVRRQRAELNPAPSSSGTSTSRSRWRR
jgi:putative transposase